MGVQRILPDSQGLKYRGLASAESAHKHGKGSYKMCVKVYLYRFSIEYRWFPASALTIAQTTTLELLYVKFSDIYRPAGHCTGLNVALRPILIPTPITIAGTSSKPLTTFVPIIVRY